MDSGEWYNEKQRVVTLLHVSAFFGSSTLTWTYCSSSLIMAEKGPKHVGYHVCVSLCLIIEQSVCVCVCVLCCVYACMCLWCVYMYVCVCVGGGGDDIILRGTWIFRVGIATCYGLNGPGIESRWGARFSTRVQTGPGAHSASYAMGKAVGAWRSPPTTIQLRDWRKRRNIPLFTLWTFVSGTKV